MRLNSHKTVIQIIADAIEAWRKPLLKKREDVADDIVRAHHDTGGVERTGIWIEPPSAGRAEELRMKANADRIFRWLDDQEKDRNLLPANFLPSLLAGLPLHVRIGVMNDILSPCGLTVRPVAETSTGLVPIQHLTEMIREDAEAHQAMATVISCGSTESLKSAQKELTESLGATQKSLVGIEAELARRMADGVSQ
ncbi:hypothetical protein H0A70_07990 [Alcaligenaceae bacterium]|nr:hypothetical protein [Alcaligenaceae bacterium]